MKCQEWCLIICVTIVQNDFQIQTLIKQLLKKMQNSYELAINFTYSQQLQLVSIIGTFHINFFYPLNLMTVACKEYTFSIFPVVSC